MNKVRAKKHLGQHFLTDLSVARRIVDALGGENGAGGDGQEDACTLEVGPGMGVLTQFLTDRPGFRVVEIDAESVTYLHAHYPNLQVIEGDFLRLDLGELSGGRAVRVIGTEYPTPDGTCIRDCGAGD